MSGIAGVWNFAGAPVDQGVFARMSRAIAHRGPDAEGCWVNGATALACRHLWVTPEEVGERHPLSGPSGARLVMDGRLDNRVELLGRLPVQGTASDAALALAAYEAWGDRFAEHLNGDFAIAVLDPARSRLLLARDALGVRPLYYHVGQGFFAFASEVKALLAHPGIPNRPDDDGLADFLLLGARPLEHPEATCFAGISAVVPAHLVTCSPERVRVARYWDFDTGRASG